MKSILIKERSVFFSWLVSYLIILLVPILISFTVYSESEKIIRNEINRANAAILKQVQQSVDSGMADVERIAMDITLNDRVRAVMYPKNIDSFYRYQLIEIITKELKSYNIANDFIESFYIYLKNSNIVLCPSHYYSLSVAYKNFHEARCISYTEWYDLLQTKYYKTCMTIPVDKDDESSDNTIAYFHSFPPEGNSMAATLVVLLNKERIIDIISSIEWIDKGSFFIIDKDSRIIISNTALDLSHILDYSKYQYADDVLHIIDYSNGIIISHIDSKIMDWKYISVIPISVFLEKVNYIQRLAIYSLLFCMVGGGIISYLFARRNYHPLEKLVSLIKKSVSITEDKNKNEYRFIQETLNNILIEKEKIHEKLEQQNNEMRLNFLRRLLQGKITDPDTIYSIAQSYNIHFNFGYFAVVLFRIEEYDRLFYGDENRNKEDKLKLVHFIISNVVEEIARLKHQGYTAEIDYTMACLININKEESSDIKKEVMKMVEDANNFIRNRLYITLTVSVSDIHDTVLGIPQAYQEALEAMEYRMVKGNLYVFPAYSGSRYHISGGLMLRKDWLDDLGLSVPETVEEWTNVLTKFKEEKGSPAPFTADAGTILNTEGVFNDPFKVGKDFYLENGKVKYGPMQPQYKEFLQLMRDWYENGLLDPDFAANDSSAIDSRIIEGQSGALFTYIGGGMGKYLNAMKDDPKFDMVAAQYPVMNKGDEPQFVLRPWEYRGEGSVAITPANKYPERSAELIDYLYSEEGALLKNFGIEGLSYNMENGYPKYTDLILNNPDVR